MSRKTPTRLPTGQNPPPIGPRPPPPSGPPAPRGFTHTVDGDEVLVMFKKLGSQQKEIDALKAGIKRVISEHGIGDALLETTREAEIIGALEELIKGK